MSQAQFFYEVDREQAEMEAANTELQILAAEAREEEIEEEYRAWMRSTLAALYERFEDGCEFDI